ncbi:MAG TPA: HAD family hydrolase [Acidimicrobiales bacterium]
MPLLLCDLDGTLVDRVGAFKRWAEDLATRTGQDATFVKWLVSLDDDGLTPKDKLYHELRARIDLDESLEEFLASYDVRYPTYFEPDPSVTAALLVARQAGWRIAVVTNGYARQAKKIAAAELAHLIDVVCISAVEDYWKPDPRLLGLAADRVGVRLLDSWMIGDSADNDIGAATAAGVSSVWLRLGRVWPRTDFRPNAEADTFAEAVAHALALGT